jgi:hypothetical protein
VVLGPLSALSSARARLAGASVVAAHHDDGEPRFQLEEVERGEGGGGAPAGALLQRLKERDAAPVVDRVERRASAHRHHPGVEPAAVGAAPIRPETERAPGRDRGVE